MSATSYPHSPNVNARSDVPYVCMDVHGGVSVPMPVGFRIMHWHDDLQFVHVLAGSVEVKTLGGSVHAMAGEAVFINTGVAHMVVADDACRYCSHLFPVELVRFERATGAASASAGVLGPAAPYLALMKSTDPTQAEVLEALTQLEQMTGASRANPTDRNVGNDPLRAYATCVRLSGLWLATLRALGQNHCLEYVAAPDERLVRVLEYIDDCFGEPIDLADLCAVGGMGKTSLTALFKRVTGSTPNAYLTEYRLKRAADMLEDGSSSAGDVAAACGFCSQSYFGKLFRERTGMSPSAWARVQVRARR